MSWDVLVPALILCGMLLSSPFEAAEPQGEPKAGWADVFPEMSGYQRTFLAATVDKDKKVYGQTVKYEWTGGAIKLLEVTLARDATFEKKYAAEALAKGPQPFTQVKIDQRAAWLRKSDKLDMKEVWPLYARLIVPLTADRALILDAKGAGPWADVTELVKHFDLKKLERALDNPPTAGK